MLKYANPTLFSGLVAKVLPWLAGATALAFAIGLWGASTGVGIAVGPKALGWIPDSKEARYLAEFGVVFLMFSIGLEFSLPQLKAMRRIVFGLGLTQVVLTVAGGVVFGILSGWGW